MELPQYPSKGEPEAIRQLICTIYTSSSDKLAWLIRYIAKRCLYIFPTDWANQYQPLVYVTMPEYKGMIRLSDLKRIKI